MNYCGTGGLGEASFRDLYQQDNIILQIIDEKGNDARKLSIKNSLKNAFSDCINKISGVKSWTMNNFDLARDSLYKDYPKPENLWDSLG
jgi:hypothetical protein